MSGYDDSTGVFFFNGNKNIKLFTIQFRKKTKKIGVFFA